ncbi:MAG: PAS domain-containing protein, partial [Bacteroidales bacterium]|nr:PAS domain-containing protein [Bacteroidales bacterium]
MADNKLLITLSLFFINEILIDELQNMSIYAFLSLFAALTTFGLGLLVYLKSSKGKLTSIFLFFAITVSILSISQFQMRIASNFDEAYLWSKLSAIWPFTLVLAIHFILELNRKKYHHFFVYFILYFPALIFSYAQFSTHLIALPPIEKYWGWSIEYNDSSLFIQIITITYVVSYWLIVLSLLYYYYKKFVGKAKTQVLYIYIGFLLNFIISITSDIVFPLLKINIPELGSISDTFTFSLIAFGIWRYDLFRLSEDHLSNKLFSTISNDLILVDANKTILEINTKLLQKLNYTHDEIFGQNLNFLLNPISNNTNPLSIHINQNSTFENRELVFISKDGSSVPLRFTASYIKLDENIKPGLIYVGTEDNLNDQNQQLKTESINQTNFLAEAALDLVKFTKTDEIHQYIIDKIYTLLHENAIIICAEVRQSSGFIKWEFKSYQGISSQLIETSKALGIDINTFKGSTKIDTISHLKEGKLNNIELNIVELTNGLISKSLGDRLIKLFGVRELNIIPLFNEER